MSGGFRYAPASHLGLYPARPVGLALPLLVLQRVLRGSGSSQRRTEGLPVEKPEMQGAPLPPSRQQLAAA